MQPHETTSGTSAQAKTKGKNNETQMNHIRVIQAITQAVNTRTGSEAIWNENGGRYIECKTGPRGKVQIPCFKLNVNQLDD